MKARAARFLLYYSLSWVALVFSLSCKAASNVLLPDSFTLGYSDGSIEGLDEFSGADFDSNAVYGELTWFLAPRETVDVEAQPHPWTWEGVSTRLEEEPGEDIALHRTEGGGWRLRIPGWLQAILVAVLAGGGGLGIRAVRRRRRSNGNPDTQPE